MDKLTSGEIEIVLRAMFNVVEKEKLTEIEKESLYSIIGKIVVNRQELINT